MDSFEINKIAGAVLGALFLVLGLGYVAESLFYVPEPKTAGYEIEIETAAASDAPAEEEVVVDVVAMVAMADPADGEKLTRGCVACHKFEKDGANGTGPALWGVMGRQIGGVDGFKYSGALLEYGAEAGPWTYELMNAWLEAPKNLVAGTSMAYSGMRKPEDRAAMLAYLRTLDDAPIDLPVAEEAAVVVEEPATDTAAAEPAAQEDTTTETAAAEPAVTEEQEAAAAEAAPAEPAGVETETAAAEAPAEAPATETAAAEAETPAASETTETASEEVDVAAAAPADEPEAPAPTESSDPVLALIASADIGEGEKLGRRCSACHVFAEGGANRVGPALYDIVGRPIASVDGFKYSEALATYGEGKTWTYELLSAWLLNSKEMVPGNKMVFQGLKKDDQRAEMIAYLRSLSSNPVALP